MIVFLVGFMGSGKTSVGKGLAKQLGIDFTDTDVAIEKSEEKTIEAIFTQHGESYFRRLENLWLHEFNETSMVVSVGGGTPCFDNNMTLMKQKGVVVYLTLPIAVMANRVQNAKAVRPLIAPYKTDFKALVRFMSDLLAKRKPFYEQADIIFEASNMTANKKQLLADMVQKCALKKEFLPK